MSQPSSGTVCVSTACLFWAISFIASRIALESVPPLTTVTLRLVVSASCFAAWFAIAGKWPRPDGRKNLLDLFFLSLFGTSLHYATQTWGLKYTTASNASVYAVTGPISILLIGSLFLQERISARKAAGISIALLGALTVTGWDTVAGVGASMAGPAGTRAAGDLLVFASIFMWGIFTVLGKSMTSRMDPLELTGAVTIIGAVTMLPAALWEISSTGFSVLSIPPRAWLAIGFLGVTCSFLATLLYLVALKTMESQKVGAFLYTIPPMTIAVSHFQLGEPLTASLVAGSLLVLAGVFMTERG